MNDSPRHVHSCSKGGFGVSVYDVRYNTEVDIPHWFFTQTSLTFMLLVANLALDNQTLSLRHPRFG